MSCYSVLNTAKRVIIIVVSAIVFQEAMERTNAQVEELNQFLESVRQGGGPEAVKRQLKRNKYLPRDRIQRLVDPGTPLLELSALAGCDAQSMRTDEPIPSGGIVISIEYFRPCNGSFDGFTDPLVSPLPLYYALSALKISFNCLALGTPNR